MDTKMHSRITCASYSTVLEKGIAFGYPLVNVIDCLGRQIKTVSPLGYWPGGQLDLCESLDTIDVTTCSVQSNPNHDADQR